MSKIEAEAPRGLTEAGREPPWSPAPAVPGATRRPWRILPLLITFGAVALAVGLGWAMWNTYMAAPWTRDGTVRAYVVTLAPEVSGCIIALPVADNQFVHKGDPLIVIDPTNYSIAVRLRRGGGEAGAGHDENAERQAGRRRALPDIAVTVEEQQTYQTNAIAAEAQYQQALADLDQARANLQRTVIHAPVNGWVTNLLAQRGDYATVGQNKISLVDADSFWMDGYFEETILAPIHVGDPAEIKLMGYTQIVHGHVDSIARGINVANAVPNGQESPRSIRSSPGCAWRSGSRCGFTSIRCRRGSPWRPG